MARFIENSRNHCALLGAIQTVQAIEGFLPIIHSTAGCGIQENLGLGKNGGSQSRGSVLPSSNVMEKQIVFGGASRLREQIKNTLKVIKADAYVVLSGCATELVGDDIPAMVKEAREQGYPVLYLQAPGFKGDVHKGYEAAVKGIIEHVAGFTLTQRRKTAGLVNILGIIPGQDVFWQGDLLVLEDLLGQVGLKANTLFGVGQTVENWAAIPDAELNLVFSPWGRKAAQYLQDKAGTSYLELSGLPVGFEATYRFLQVLAEFFPIPEHLLQAVYERETKRQDYYLNRLTDVYFTTGVQREFAVVGESAFVLGVQDFLTNTLGMIPKVLVFTDDLAAEDQRNLIEKANRELAPFATEIVFHEDQQQIFESILRNEVELILGSSLEKSLSEQQQIPFLPISFPVTDQILLSRSYIGFNGAVTLMEDIIRQIRAGR